MKEFLILHYGFEKPGPAEMGQWNAWFESIADIEVDRGHLPNGRELTAAGRTELPFGRDSMTGFTIIRAEDLDSAEQIASGCPIVDATRVYEIMRSPKG